MVKVTPSHLELDLCFEVINIVFYNIWLRQTKERERKPFFGTITMNKGNTNILTPPPLQQGHNTFFYKAKAENSKLKVLLILFSFL